MWFILALVFSVLCALIANAKNRSVLTAIICGFLFGIFAIIYYIAVDKKEEEK